MDGKGREEDDLMDNFGSDRQDFGGAGGRDLCS